MKKIKVGCLKKTFYSNLNSNCHNSKIKSGIFRYLHFFERFVHPSCPWYHIRFDSIFTRCLDFVSTHHHWTQIAFVFRIDSLVSAWTVPRSKNSSEILLALFNSYWDFVKFDWEFQTQNWLNFVVKCHKTDLISFHYGKWISENKCHTHAKYRFIIVWYSYIFFGWTSWH